MPLPLSAVLAIVLAHQMYWMPLYPYPITYNPNFTVPTFGLQDLL